MNSFIKLLKEKKIIYYIAASLLSITIFFTVIEFATRTVSFFSGNGFFLRLDELDPYDKPVESGYQWHPFVGMTLKPLLVFTGGHPDSKETVKIFADKHGFLAEDNTLTYGKQKDEIRIATIGASTTASFNLNFHQNWPGRLGILVQEALPGKKIRIINAAIPGFDTAQSIGNLALRVIPFDPDIVIIYHAYNDLKAVRYDVKFSPDYVHIHPAPYGFHKKPPFFILWLNRSMAYVRVRNKYRAKHEELKAKEDLTNPARIRQVPLQAERTFEEHMRTLVAIAHSSGAKTVLSSFATLNDPNSNYGDRNIVKGLSNFQKKGLYTLLHFTPGLTLEGIFSGINRYNRVLKKVAESENTGWVDNANLVPYEDKYFVDRVHFSREGAARMAENFLPVVLELLKE